MLHAVVASLISSTPGHEEDKINENLGGISGGPVFRVIEHIDLQPRHIAHVLADGIRIRRVGACGYHIVISRR